MLVAVNYRFHDYNDELFVIDTSLLRDADPVERLIKESLEQGKHRLQIDGNQFGEDQFEDKWRGLNESKVDLPCQIDALANIHICFDI